MPVLLEVIVTSVEEAVEAASGGADRLEIVHSLDHGGFTPRVDVVREIVRAVGIPVRAMVREDGSMSSTAAMIERLRRCAGELAEAGADGLVLGFTVDGRVDVQGTRAVLAAAPGLAVTFHRAFDHADDASRALEHLATIAQVDRVLTNGGNGAWDERVERVVQWQQAAGPRLRMIFAMGRETRRTHEILAHPEITEVHVGRAARRPRESSGRVHREEVAALKRALTDENAGSY